jgi:hypothetical protein
LPELIDITIAAWFEKRNSNWIPSVVDGISMGISIHDSDFISEHLDFPGNV